MPPLPRHPPWFGHPSYIRWRVQIINVSNLLFRRPTKRSVKVPQSVRFPHWRRVSFTLIQYKYKYNYGLVHLHIYTSVYRQKNENLYELWTERLESFPKSLRHTKYCNCKNKLHRWVTKQDPQMLLGPAKGTSLYLRFAVNRRRSTGNREGHVVPELLAAWSDKRLLLADSGSVQSALWRYPHRWSKSTWCP